MSDEITSQLDSLAAFPDTLKRQLQGVSDAALRFRRAPEEWSAIEVVGHLVDVEALWQGRLRQMLASDHPALAPVDEAWVRQRDYQHKQIGFLLITLAERRAEQLELLRMLRPAQLARTGVHPTRGPISVADAIGIMAWHDGNHSGQITANLAAYQSSENRG